MLNIRKPRPSIFVVGDAKCGTGSLHRAIELSRDLATSSPRKELHYFGAPELLKATAGPGEEGMHQDIIQDEESYLREYSHVPSSIENIVEVSPSYLRNPEAAKRISEFSPKARIIVLVREPAAKVFSQYLHLWGQGRETLNFEEAFEQSESRRVAGYSGMFNYARGGAYDEPISVYINVFGPERVLVVLFDELFGDSTETRSKVENFLGGSLPRGPLPHLNMGGQIKSPLTRFMLNHAVVKGILPRMVPVRARNMIRPFLYRHVKVSRPSWIRLQGPGCERYLLRRPIA